MKHIIIDVESLSIRSRAVITQVAGVLLTEEGLVPGSEFKANIGIDLQIQAGSVVDHETLAWWVKQKPQVFAQTLLGETYSPEVFCRSLRKWWDRNIHGEEEKGVSVWASDPLLDFGGIVRLHEMSGYLLPWTHRQQRDARTLRWAVDQQRRDEFSIETLGPPPSSKVMPDVPHDALSDAKALAKEVWSNLRTLRVPL